MKATGIALVVVFSKDTTIVAIVRALYHNNKVILSLALSLSHTPKFTIEKLLDTNYHIWKARL